MSFVEFKDVKKIYKTGEIVIEAVRGVDFTINEGELVIVVGPSGAGKGTLGQKLLREDPSFHFSVSATTRSPRFNEIDGVHYQFITISNPLNTSTTVPGDANCDGIVNVLDVICLANYIAGQNPDPFCFENADVSGDGIINLLDIILTVNIIIE